MIMAVMKADDDCDDRGNYNHDNDVCDDEQRGPCEDHGALILIAAVMSTTSQRRGGCFL